jgi:hypothetical protein
MIKLIGINNLSFKILRELELVRVKQQENNIKKKIQLTKDTILKNYNREICFIVKFFQKLT